MWHGVQAVANSNGGWNEGLLHTFFKKGVGQNPSSGLTFDEGNL
jgi:hypothetical protein